MPTERIGIQEMDKESTGSTDQAGQNCDIIIVHPDLIDSIWPNVEPHLERIGPHSEGELTPEDFRTHLESAEMQLWLAIHDKVVLAAMITQIIVYPRKRTVRIIAIGGDDMKRWLHYLPLVEDWGFEMGCTYLELWGRKGWKKVLSDWKSSYIVLTKEIVKRIH